MTGKHSDGAMFQALLRFWRNKRGLSQLDLSMMANVSARHISFLENGRAQPSDEMILRLAQTLDLSMRDKNAMLVAAGYEARFAVTPPTTLSPSVRWVLEKMLAHHEPYPFVVLSPGYEVVLANQGALRLVQLFVHEPESLSPALNIFDLVLDPRLIRESVVEWPSVARLMIERLQREQLMHPNDQRLTALMERSMGYPGVREFVSTPDFTVNSEAILPFRLKRNEHDLRFVTTAMVFSAPQNVTMEELLIESYYPADEATDRAWRALSER